MQAFDHDKPANKEEWLFAFVSAYRKLRPEIGDKYAKLNATTAYNTHKDKAPAIAAKLWAKR